MKTVKQFLLAITAVSFFFITGCTTMQNIPYDGVYYSTTKGAPQNLVAQNTHPTTTAPTHVKVINIESINNAGKETTSAKSGLEGYSVDTLRTDTISANKVDSVVYSHINTGLGFNNPYFGTGIESWSLGGYAGFFGYNYGYGYYNPFWDNFYYPFSSPYYYGGYPFYSFGGWGLYGLGYPYLGFGFGYPYYGYGFGYPYYGYGYFGYPYYYGRYRYDRYFGHRNTLMSGSRLPVGGAGGLVPYSVTKSARVGNAKPSGIRPSAVSEKNTGVNAVRRPAGSMRYQKALNEAKARGLVNNGRMLQKPPVYRSTEKTVPVRQYTKPVYNRQRMGMSTPRYQKPKQYQSLDTRQARSSNEYFRPQPQTIINGRTTRINTVRRAPQRFNIYRPSRSGSQTYRYRPVYRSSYRSTPVQRYTAPRFYSSPTFNRSNYQAPVRISTGTRTGGGGGGGGHRGGGGGGHIR